MANHAHGTSKSRRVPLKNSKVVGCFQRTIYAYETVPHNFEPVSLSFSLMEEKCGAVMLQVPSDRIGG